MRVLRECPRGGILNLEAHLPHSALRANRRAFYRLERTFVKCWIFDGHCHPPLELYGIQAHAKRPYQRLVLLLRIHSQG